MSSKSSCSGDKLPFLDGNISSCFSCGSNTMTAATATTTATTATTATGLRNLFAKVSYFKMLKNVISRKFSFSREFFCLLGSGCGKKNCFRNHFLKIFLPVDDFAKADSG